MSMPSQTTGRKASWVIRYKDTKEVLLETFDKVIADTINTAKYEAVPISQYLQELNQLAA